MLGAQKQKNWLSDQSFVKKYGFHVVDTTDYGIWIAGAFLTEQYQGSLRMSKKQEIESKELTIYYDMQCPYVCQNIEMIKEYCEMNDVPLSLIQVDTL